MDWSPLVPKKVCLISPFTTSVAKLSSEEQKTSFVLFWLDGLSNFANYDRLCKKRVTVIK
jgi:hypothetical protein